ncbi:MAG: DUF4124 domain-containing protein [Betaproteobacteria bacterium]|nr:DUF4124 domain-containing protein [Betaproteobacteria bacterium]
MNLIKPLIAITLTMASLSALAQWQWIDKDGRKIFSDRGPGPDVPEKNILKRPAGIKPAGSPLGAETPTTSAPAQEALPALPKDAGVDKALDVKKKQAEAAEAAKKKTEEGRIAKAKADNCKLARQAKSTLDSGVRISRTNTSGEREFLDDAARAAEAQRIQGVIDADCK